MTNKGYNYYVSLKRGLKNPKTGGKITLSQIATILEKGSSSRNIAKRPLWSDTYKQIGGNKSTRQAIESAIYYEFRKRYGIRPERYAR